MRKCALLAVLLCGPALAQIAKVQSAANWNPCSPYSGTTVTCTVTLTTTTNNNLLAVWAVWQTTFPYVAAVSDPPVGNGWYSAVGPTLQHASSGAPASAQIFYAKKITGSGTGNNEIIKVTFTCPATNPLCSSPTITSAGLVAVEYSGLDTTNPLDSVSEAISNTPSSTLDSGTASPANANLLLFGGGTSDVGSLIAGPLFTAIQASPSGNSITEQQIVSGNTTLQRATAIPNPAPSGGGNWLMQMAVFRGATWTVAQGSSSTRFHGVLDASQFPGADIGAQITAAIAALPTVTWYDYTGAAYSFPAGEIYIPAGKYTFATNIVVPSPLVTMRGAGPNATVLNFTGTGIAISHTQPSVGSGNIIFNNNIISDLTLDGHGNANNNVTGLYCANVQSPSLTNVMIQNFSTTGSVGFWQDSGNTWMERVNMRAVWMANNTVSWKITKTTTNTGDTFGYSFIDVYINVGTGQTGILSVGESSAKPANFSYSLLHIIINGGAYGGVGISLTNNSVWQEISGTIHIEGCTTGMEVDGTSSFTFTGAFTSLYNSGPDTVAAGGVMNYVDFSSQFGVGEIATEESATASSKGVVPPEWYWSGSYWNGTGSAADTWQMGMVNYDSAGTSDFLVAHTAGPATARFSVPELLISPVGYGGNSTTLSASTAGYYSISLPAESGTVVVDAGEGVGNGTASTTVTTTTQGTGTGPASPQVIVKYMKVVGADGNTYYIPLMQ